MAASPGVAGRRIIFHDASPANGSEPGASHSLTRLLLLLPALPCQLPRGRKGDGSMRALERGDSFVAVPGGSGGLLLSPRVTGERVPRGCYTGSALCDGGAAESLPGVAHPPADAMSR